MLSSCRNQSIDLLCKSIGWFLYEGKTGTYWVNIGADNVIKQPWSTAPVKYFEQSKKNQAKLGIIWNLNICRGLFRTMSKIYNGVFVENSERLSPFHIFLQKALPQMFDRVPSSPQICLDSIMKSSFVKRGQAQCSSTILRFPHISSVEILNHKSFIIFSKFCEPYFVVMTKFRTFLCFSP